MATSFLPTLSHFQNDNSWLASDGRMRYKLIPTLEGEEGGILTAELWEGPWAYAFSTVEETATFPLSAEGLEELRQWLDQKALLYNARPHRTMEENLKRRTDTP